MKAKEKFAKSAAFILFLAALPLPSERDLRPSAFSRAPEPSAPVELSSLPLIEETALAREDASAAQGPEGAADRALRELFSQEKFEAALRLSQQQLQNTELSEAYKTWLRRQLPQIKLGWAWSLVRKKNCQDALALFDETLHSGPQAAALKGLGYCYLERRDWWTAATYLDSYIEQKATDPEGYLLLAEAKESLGSFDEALSLTRKAQELKSLSLEEGNALLQRSETLAARADESLSQAETQSGNFTIRFQAAEHSHLIDASLELLQATELSLSEQLGINPLEHPIEVIFHKVESFDKVTHGPSWAAAIYDGRIRVPVPPGQEVDGDFAKILRHELSHAMLSEHVGKRQLPAWFQEGLAQVAECPQLCWNYRFAATQQGFMRPEYFGESFLKLTSWEAPVAYKQSFYLFQVLYRINGLLGVRQIIEGMPRLPSLDSDALLRQNGLSFADLHQRAQDFWTRQVSF